MNHSKRCLAIVNPTSGRERAAHFIPLLASVLSERYEDVSFKITQKPNDAKIFAQEAAMQHMDVICMGGDGTINEAINGIVPINSSSVFGFIPLGTVNDLARALHIPRTPKVAIEMLRTAKISHIDVGRANDRYFTNIVAAGLIPDAVSQVTIKEKTMFGSLAYFMKGMQVFPKQHPFHVVIEEDGKKPVHIESPLIAAMLTDSAGSFRILIPPEDRNNGVIKLALFHDFQFFRTLKEAPKLLTGVRLGKDILTIINFKKARISITGNNIPIHANIDGDYGAYFPIDLEIFPKRLPIFVPSKIKNESPLFPHILSTKSLMEKIHWPDSSDTSTKKENTSKTTI